MPATFSPRMKCRRNEYCAGRSPLVIAAPHVGTYIPADIATTLSETGLKVGETDYHVHRLFDFAQALGATTLWATYSCLCR